jgi:hypothetical protein
MTHKKCNKDEHDWIETKDKSFHVRGCGETLEKEVKCKKCEIIGREVWCYDTTEEGEL